MSIPEAVSPAAGPQPVRSGRAGARPSRAARRVGYLVAAAFDVLVLTVLLVSPGWEAASFLTADADRVVGLVAASVVVSLVANVVWVVADPPRLRALGEVVTSVLGVVVCARLLDVFPFTFDDGSHWPTVLRVLLWLGLVGSSIGVLTNLVALVRGPRTPPAT